MAADGADRDLPFWRLAVYALPAVPMSFLFVPLTALLPAFYAQELGLSLSVVGGFLLVSRLFDMVVDPFLGRLSDGTRSRYGRRKPWIALGAPICMVGAVLVFMPPAQIGGWWLLMATAVIYFGASMLGLSHAAWGAEIVQSYHGRSKVAGFRESANVLGIVVASSVPAITALQGHGIDRYTMAVMGWTVVILTPLTAWAALRFVPERLAPPETPSPWLPALRSLLRNRPFCLLCAGYVVLNIGAGITNATLVFFISHYLKQPEVIGPTLLASFGAVLAGVPFWVAVSRRIGKHRAAGLSLLVAISLSGLLATQLRPGDGWLFVALMAVLGITSAAFLTLPLGIMGDVIDYDTLKTGESRGGLFFGFWAFFSQISPAIAVGAALPLLEAAGFHPRGPNAPEALQALRYVYCLAPIPFFLFGAWMFLTFPLDARRHGIVRRRLDRRAARPSPPAQTVSAPPLEAS
ncbi:MAG: MFS transporter [Phenylobacterium sp.]|uniref:MFS transporter n=1 Tax=Phenylobacterium sp. TaxID=1871053 RepID=UPI001A4EB08A|nr:MFS transporter [Phenylobacterium sp.]MBL8772094.1 MFS transporter [Phenylobacterium sp.]